MHRGKGVLPGVGLREVVVHLARLKGGQPTAVGARPNQSGFGVQYGAVSGGPTVVFRAQIGAAGGFRQTGNAPVVVGVLQRFGHGFRGVLHAQVALLAVGGKAKNGGLGRGVCRAQRGFQRNRIALNVRIRQHRHRVVPNHAIRFVRRQFPNREASAQRVVVQHRRYKIVRALGLRQGIQGMRRAVRVPQAEDRVALVQGVLVHRVVHPAVPAVHVAPQIWNGKSVVECRSEHHHLVRRSLHFNFSQFAFPIQRRRSAGVVKRRLAPGFRRPVAPCALGVRGGQRHVQI